MRLSHLMTRPWRVVRGTHASLQLTRLDDRTAPAVLLVTSTGDSGSGTLRAALAASADGDSIQFDASLSGQAIDLTSGELSVTTSVSITGPGADLLTVRRDAANTTLLFRIFTVAGGETVSMSGITVSDGLLDTQDNDGPVIITAYGGGVYNAASGSLDVLNSQISGNGAVAFAPGLAAGGGIYSAGELTVTDSTVNGNTAYGYMVQFVNSTRSAEGGGIWNAGALTLDGVVVSGNILGGGTDSAYVEGHLASEGYGGGIYATGDTTIMRSVIADNLASGRNPNTAGSRSGGGGLYNAGGAVVTDSWLKDNEANYQTGSTYPGEAFGGGVWNTGTLQITRSAITGNSLYAAQTRGGGVYNTGTATLTNVTVSGNTASYSYPEGMADNNSRGGGLANDESGELTLRFVTVTDNHTTAVILNPTTAPNAFAIGGGVWTGSNATTDADSTIIAGNDAVTWSAFYYAYPIYYTGQDVSGSLATSTYNLIGGSPGLGTLQHNGGLGIGYNGVSVSPTHAVLIGSAALAAGNPATAPATDQRGVARNPAAPNIGAYEQPAEEEEEPRPGAGGGSRWSVAGAVAGPADPWAINEPIGGGGGPRGWSVAPPPKAQAYGVIDLTAFDQLIFVG